MAKKSKKKKPAAKKRPATKKKSAKKKVAKKPAPKTVGFMDKLRGMMGL